MTEHYDALETRDPEVREREQMAALAQQIAHARQSAPAYARLLADVEPEAVRDRAALARLPLTRKADLVAAQAAEPPFGGLAARPLAGMARVYMSPGPIHEPDTERPDYWRFARALFAAGFRKGELVHNCFAYHMTPAGRMIESGAHALGCPVFPGGVGNTELQVQAIARLRPAGYGGTPSFLKIILDKAKETGSDASSLTKALVSGEAFPPVLRADIAGHGCQALQAYGTADLGLVAYESEAREGLILDEGALVEIVRPGTGDPVPDGEVGEVVVTVLNPDYPLIRFATGDLSAILPGASPCGRTNRRIRGWMGRADQTAKVRGMFVHPQQVAAAIARHPDVLRARLVITNPDGLDHAELACETPPGAGYALAQAVAESFQHVCKVRAEVRLAAAGSLPNDGKVIDDRRTVT